MHDRTRRARRSTAPSARDAHEAELIRDFGGPEGTMEAALKRFNAHIRERWAGFDVNPPVSGNLESMNR